MKTLTIVAFAIVILFFACTKSNLNTPAESTSVQSSDAALSAAAKTRTTLLTAHQWMYQGYYFHYIDQAHKGDPQYVRGSNNNIINLDATRYTFRKNGTFTELDGGYTYPGTWQFTNGADTVIAMTYSWGTDVNSILTLNNNHLNYTMPIGSYSHNNFAYTELVTAQ